ncbi:hypothetical protein [Parendozoicomonas haliclonae]|uniref:Uncharacterized protein n=1 Tax=Parendozoicomonas haliclonae TaxID=1960125 RepID=A0A1X7AM18_9GAMM|nr:hypothetical protein [Parendozoicomonas haliclonae]SMA48892.1 hypothetical protein EHSB41UT_02957 [Parendozoicomonas haliclonae]
MRIFHLISAALLLIPSLVLAENYTITVNGKAYDFSLNENKLVKVGNQHISVKLQQKDFISFVSDSFSFMHSSKFTPSTNDLGDGIYQTGMMTPIGTTVIVQEYKTLDPSLMIDIMVSEVTKEEVQYGYNVKSEPAHLTLSDGKVLKGKLVTSKYQDTDIKRYILTYGATDSGILIMTQIDEAFATNEKEIIDRFFESLAISM